MTEGGNIEANPDTPTESRVALALSKVRRSKQVRLEEEPKVEEPEPEEEKPTGGLMARGTPDGGI